MNIMNGPFLECGNRFLFRKLVVYEKLKIKRSKTINKDLEARRRKEFGAFYTPSHLAQSMTETAIDHYLTRHLNQQIDSKFLCLNEILNTAELSEIVKLRTALKSIRILDGAAGEGEFLRASIVSIRKIEDKINTLLKSDKKNSDQAILDIFNSNFFGMEINPKAISMCYKNLIKLFSNPPPSSFNEILSTNIVLGDFLESSLSDWTSLPSTTNGFDIVIGNPPWGGKLSKSQREYYYDKFGLQSPKRNLNTFSLFVYKAANLITPDKGLLAYLLPKNIARSNQYIHLRKFLATNFQILSINFHGLFQDVTQEFISLIGAYSKNISLEHMILIDGKNRVPQVSYTTNIDFIFTKEFNSQSQQIIKLIHEDSTPLNQFLTIKRGEELSKRGGVMYCPNCIEWVPLSSRKTLIQCSSCHNSLPKINLKTKYIIQKTPTSKKNQPILTGDDFEAFSINKTHFIDPKVIYRSKKDPSIYSSPKLVVQKIKPFLCAAYDSNNYWTTQNVYNLTLTTEYSKNSDLLFYILSILNSSLYRWFYESQFNLGSKYTNAISIRNLKRLPLKNPDLNNPLFHQIVHLAKEITVAKPLKTQLIQELDKLILQYYHCETFSIPVSSN
ncbi:MAG: Eco57I restriction-modification methylase domain-containing protein [Promethearchaeota archaeon]